MKISFFPIFVFLFGSLQAENFKISIRYLSLPVVKVQMENTDNHLVVKAKATGLATIATKMNNYYEIKHDTLFYPIYYYKKIEQSDYSEHKTISYNRLENIALEENFITDKKKNYNIHHECRDFFSSLFFLRTQLSEHDSGELWLDANSLIWKVSWEKLALEKLKTFNGQQKTFKIRLRFEKIGTGGKQRSDMLTHNLVNEENDLFFWFTAENFALPVKAVFAMKPFPVVWILDEYQE
jgi:hypothetical protein